MPLSHFTGDEREDWRGEGGQQTKGPLMTSTPEPVDTLGAVAKGDQRCRWNEGC